VVRVARLLTAALAATVLAACGGADEVETSSAMTNLPWATPDVPWLACLERKGAEVEEHGETLSGHYSEQAKLVPATLFGVDFQPGDESNFVIEAWIYRNVREAHEALTPYCFRQDGSEPCLDNTITTARWGTVVVDWDEPPEPTMAAFETCLGGPPDELGP
jgi:hypothetical protein